MRAHLAESGVRLARGETQDDEHHHDDRERSRGEDRHDRRREDETGERRERHVLLRALANGTTRQRIARRGMTRALGTLGRGSRRLFEHALGRRPRRRSELNSQGRASTSFIFAGEERRVELLFVRDPVGLALAPRGGGDRRPRVVALGRFARHDDRHLARGRVRPVRQQCRGIDLWRVGDHLGGLFGPGDPDARIGRTDDGELARRLVLRGRVS